MKPLLIADSLINLALGGILLAFQTSLTKLLGIPQANTAFYPNILGAVLFGIGIALLIEARRKKTGLIGLGLAGAIAINLSGGFVLILWLLFGSLEIPLKGQIILWTLAILLIAISCFEIWAHRHAKNL